jgi:hypothetical protein
MSSSYFCLSILLCLSSESVAFLPFLSFLALCRNVLILAFTVTVLAVLVLVFSPISYFLIHVSLILITHLFLRSRVAQSVQCLTTDWTTGPSRFDPRQGQRIFPLSSVSRPALGPTQPPVQWVPGVLSTGLKRGRGMTLTTHPHLVPRS